MVELVVDVVDPHHPDRQAPLAVERRQRLDRRAQPRVGDDDVVGLLRAVQEVGGEIELDGDRGPQDAVAHRPQHHLPGRWVEVVDRAVFALLDHEVAAVEARSPAAVDHHAAGAGLGGHPRPHRGSRGVDALVEDQAGLLRSDQEAAGIAELDPVQQHRVDERIAGPARAGRGQPAPRDPELEDVRTVLGDALRHLELDPVGLLAVPLAGAHQDAVEVDLEAVVAERFDLAGRGRLSLELDRQRHRLPGIRPVVSHPQRQAKRLRVERGQAVPEPDVGILAVAAVEGLEVVEFQVPLDEPELGPAFDAARGHRRPAHPLPGRAGDRQAVDVEQAVPAVIRPRPRRLLADELDVVAGAEAAVAAVLDPDPQLVSPLGQGETL